MIDALREPTQLREASKEDNTGSGGPPAGQAGTLSFAARVRAILLLSLLCWAMLIAALYWLLA